MTACGHGNGLVFINVYKPTLRVLLDHVVKPGPCSRVAGFVYVDLCVCVYVGVRPMNRFTKTYSETYASE